MILVLALLLRLWQVGESLWIDELHTSWVVSGKLSDVLPRAAMGNQSPLYFWGIWLLVQVTGQSEWTLRLPSLMAGIALPVGVFVLVGRPFRAVGDGPEGPYYIAALAAALLIAIDPTCIFYSQEARPYAWVMLLAVLELLLLRQLIERPTIGWRMALLVNSLVLFYLHYTTAIFLAGIVVLLPMLVRQTGSAYRTKDLVIDLVLAAVLAAPGVVQMADIFERRTNWVAFVETPSCHKLFTEVPFAAWAMIGVVVVGMALLVPRLLPGNALSQGSASVAPGMNSPPYGVLWFSALVASMLTPLILSWTVTRFDAARIYHVRYLVALVPLAATATCLATEWIPWRTVQAMALVALAGWHLYDGGMLEQFVRDGRFLAERNEDWRGAVNYLNLRLAEDDSAIVILEPDLIEVRGLITVESELRYAMFAVTGIYGVESPHLYLGRSWSGIVSELELIRDWRASGHRRVWYVVRSDSPSANDLVQGYARMSSLGEDLTTIARVADYQSFGRIHLISLAPVRRN